MSFTADALFEIPRRNPVYTLDDPDQFQRSRLSCFAGSPDTQARAPAPASRSALRSPSSYLSSPAARPRASVRAVEISRRRRFAPAAKVAVYPTIRLRD